MVVLPSRFFFKFTCWCFAVRAKIEDLEKKLAASQAEVKKLVMMFSLFVLLCGCGCPVVVVVVVRLNLLTLLTTPTCLSTARVEEADWLSCQAGHITDDSHYNDNSSDDSNSNSSNCD